MEQIAAMLGMPLPALIFIAIAPGVITALIFILWVNNRKK